MIAGNFPQAREARDGGCNSFIPGTIHGGWRCPAIIVQNRLGDECFFIESGDRWVAILNPDSETSVDQLLHANDQSFLGRFQRRMKLSN